MFDKDDIVATLEEYNLKYDDVELKADDKAMGKSCKDNLNRIIAVWVCDKSQSSTAKDLILPVVYCT